MMRYIPGMVMVTMAVLLLVISEAAALERMTSQEMGGVTAQGGISLALDEVMVFNYISSFTIKDVGTLDSQGNPLADGYFTGGFESLFSSTMSFDLDIGASDPQGPMIFYGTVGDISGIRFSQESGETSFTYSYDDISVWNHQLSEETHLGDFSVSNAALLDASFTLFPPAGDGDCGVRMLAEFQKSIESIGFSTTDGTGDDLAISGVMIGGTFSGVALPEDNLGTAPINTATWAFDQGMFRLGIPHYESDPVGTAGHENTTLSFAIDISDAPRTLGDGSTYVAPHLVIDAPMAGSFRVQSVSSGDFDFGPMAIDGIRLYKNLIEFPGRGIGN
ncbi:MAG: hypothetical protein JEZ12_26125 [Desulfobacterium sp.]|nr:hypothetical protein [Desulfobacterium sp.]